MILKMSHILKVNIKDSYKSYKNNCLWYNDKKSIWYQNDEKYNNFSLDQWIGNTINHYFQDIYLNCARIDFDINKQHVYDTYNSYWTKQVKVV